MRPLLLLTTALLVALLVPAAPALGAWTWPLQGEVITSYRNGDDPYAGGQHRGIDIAGPLGAAVVAAAAGEVRFAGIAGSSGLTVSVRTDDGFDTSYLHLGSARVRAGERVSAGQRLGDVGTSGVRSTATPHLHFGVREAGSRHAYRDPLAFLPPPSAPAPEAPATAPLPEPAPAAPVVALEPVRAPSPVRRRVPGARRIPVRRPAPVPRRVPLPGRSPVRRRVPQPRSVPLAAPEPAARPVRTPQPRKTPSGRPAPAPAAHGDRTAHALERLGLGPSPARAPEAPHAPDVGPARSAPPGRPSAGARGPDLGLALACVGVLLAAAILAFSGDAGPAKRRGGARLAAVIRPLLGRR